jgi:hypothetical protein
MNKIAEIERVLEEWFRSEDWEIYHRSDTGDIIANSAHYGTGKDGKSVNLTELAKAIEPNWKDRV